MSQLVECVPNFSEGRRDEVIAQIVAVVEQAEAAGKAVRLLDHSADRDHNRMVVTYVGEPEAVSEVAFQLAARAAQLIDMNAHRGAHPRIGATDVIPFIPISEVSIAECVALAQRLGARLADELGIPVYLYAEAATTPTRKRLPDVRKGEYEGLQQAITSPERRPDFTPAGEPHLHPTAGATAVGARPYLIAYNINLDTPNLEVAKRVSKAVRESSGGLMNVQAMGVDLAALGLAQVSMNLLNHKATPIYRAYELVRIEAARYGANIAHSELIGLLPLDAMTDTAAYYLERDHQPSGGLADEQLIHEAAAYLKLEGFSPQQVLEVRLRDMAG